MQNATRRDLGVVTDGRLRDIAPQRDGTTRDIANQRDGTTPTSRPHSAHQPLPKRAPLPSRGAPAAAPAQAPASRSSGLDEKEIKAQFPEAGFDERRQRWIVVRNRKAYGVK